MYIRNLNVFANQSLHYQKVSDFNFDNVNFDLRKRYITTFKYLSCFVTYIVFGG